MQFDGMCDKNFFDLVFGTYLWNVCVYSIFDFGSHGGDRRIDGGGEETVWVEARYI